MKVFENSDFIFNNYDTAIILRVSNLEFRMHNNSVYVTPYVFNFVSKNYYALQELSRLIKGSYIYNNNNIYCLDVTYRDLSYSVLDKWGTFNIYFDDIYINLHDFASKTIVGVYEYLYKRNPTQQDYKNYTSFINDDLLPRLHTEIVRYCIEHKLLKGIINNQHFEPDRLRCKKSERDCKAAVFGIAF